MVRISELHRRMTASASYTIFIPRNVMTRSVSRTASSLLSVLVLLATGSTVVAAQPTPAKTRPGRLPVLVALVEQPLHGAGTLIMRRAGTGNSDIIVVVRDAAAPSRIAAAVMVLSAVMTDEGDEPKQDQLLRVPDAAAAPPTDVAKAARVTALATASPAVYVEGVGEAHTTFIHVADATLRTTLAQRGKASVRAKPRKN